MTEQKEWKKLYEELLQQHEQQIAAEKDLSKLLNQTIVRLTLAANGLDAQLDPHLKSIRDAVRAGVTPSLKEKLNSLSDSLIHFSEESADEAQAIKELCYQLTARLSLSKQDAAELSRLLIYVLSNPAKTSEGELDRLASLFQTHTPVAEEKKSGLFGRLLKTSATPTDKKNASINRLLLNLIEQANWPGHWSVEINQLKTRLSNQASEHEWLAVFEELLELTAQSYGEARAEIREAEDFLGELTQRLQELEEHLRGRQAGWREVVDQGQKLNEEVNSQMGGLYSSVSRATDLEQLKWDIKERLSGIQRTMDLYLQEQQQWHTRIDAAEQQLQVRLRELDAESKQLHERLFEAHELAHRDALTGLPNRLAYDERVAQEYARWKRFAEPLSILVWDVDNFKLINDRFGHQAGDKALRVIAKCLQQRVRETDFMARYGGEEFVTLLCGADAEGAWKVAEQMRQSVMQSGFHSGGKAVPVTISCGISQFREGDKVKTVFERADKALYQAKRMGKNRCEMA